MWYGYIMVDKGIYLARLGRREEAMASWAEVVRRARPHRDVVFWASDERATRLLCAAHLKQGRVEEALSIYDALCQDVEDMSAVDFFFRLRMFAARLAVRVGQWRRDRRVLDAATEEFRNVYRAFDPDNDTMARVMLPPVIELIAMGAPEGEVLDVLVSEEKKAAVLWPLVVALRLRRGESVLQPAEVIAIAADVNKQIEARKGGSAT